MALFKDVRNTINTALFGQQNTTQEQSKDMLSARMKKSSGLITSTNDLPGLLDLDPLGFEHFQYPEDLNTLSNGHYIKFDIYENRLSTVAKAPKPNRPLDLGLNNTTFTDVAKNITRQSGDEAKTSEDLDHIAKNNQNAGDDTQLGPGVRQDEISKKVLKSIKTNGNINTMKRVLKGKKPHEINKLLDLHSHTHSSTSSASILLYTSPTNTFSTSATYENAETGFLADFLGGTNIVDSIATGSAAALTKLTGAAIKTALEVIVPGAGGFFSRSTGMAENPNIELAFKSVPFRSFQFDYKFAPKTKTELDSIHKIIQLFRFHMSPSLLGHTQYFASPSQFMLSYMYRDGENMYIPRITKCVLENLDVDYSPGEKFTTLKPDNTGASPQIITMKMGFKEMSIITKETIAENY
tara:strand:+ start:167 stop:1396 length:1230 start_codon:yes stop_codon:yes gene_type:complete